MASARKNVMLGTAGHVDHGKTALVKLLTGCDTDTLAEEKARGLTIDLGFAPCRMKDERIVGIVDVPGHVDFIRNMVAGAQGIDVVILVVAADDSVMPQTREHLDILTLMGVRHGLVALTKSDLVDAEMLQLVAEDVRKFLAGTFLESAAVCPISNITGAGFDGFFTALNAAVAACRERPVRGLFRLWVERTFNVHGFGTVVSGIPSSGEVRVGDRLVLQPTGQAGRVRRLEVYGEEAQVGRAGECVAMNLTDIDPSAMARGMVLCEGDAFPPVTMVEAELQLLERIGQGLKDYAEVHLHIGTAETMVNVALLEDKKHMDPGSRQRVQLRLRQPLAIAPGERFVLRTGTAGQAEGRLTTIGGGRVLATSNVRLRRNRPWTLASLAGRQAAIDSPSAWCALQLQEAGEPLSPAALAQRAQMKAENVAEVLTELKAAAQVLEAGGGAVVHRRTVEQLAAQVKEALEAFHAANPLRMGIAEADLRGRLQADKAVLELALAHLAAAQAIQRQGGLVALGGRKLQISPQDQALCRQIEDRLRAAHLEPPSPTELAEEMRVPPDRMNKMLQLLADQSAVVRLDEKVVMHSQAVEAGKKVVLDLFAKAGGFETVAFRDALGVSRKYAVPLLDHYDTLRLTVRSGSRRTPGAVAKQMLQEGRRGEEGRRS